MLSAACRDAEFFFFFCCWCLRALFGWTEQNTLWNCTWGVSWLQKINFSQPEYEKLYLNWKKTEEFLSCCCCYLGWEIWNFFEELKMLTLPTLLSVCHVMWVSISLIWLYLCLLAVGVGWPHVCSRFGLCQELSMEGEGEEEQFVVTIAIRVSSTSQCIQVVRALWLHSLSKHQCAVRWSALM